jgi:hypothetical protein
MMKVYWERDDESTQLKDHCEVFLQGGIRERVNLGRYFCNSFFLSYLLCVFAGRYKKWGEKLVAGLCSLFSFQTEVNSILEGFNLNQTLIHANLCGSIKTHQWPHSQSSPKYASGTIILLSFLLLLCTYLLFF